MLSNINISNLENSFSKTSIYSDACENSFQVEQQYIKIHKSDNINNNEIKSLNENNFVNVNKSEELKLLNKIFENNDLDNNIFSNECLTQNNLNSKNKDTKEKMINNINNRYIINKNINCNNINKINLSNVNIIINNDKEKNENINNKGLDNILEISKKIKNISSKSIKSLINNNNTKRENKSLYEIDNKNENSGKENFEKEKLDKDLNININIDNSKSIMQNNIKKNNLNFSSMSNIDLNALNDFQNLTIITKKKKKGANNSLSKSIVVAPNKSLSFSSNENSFYKLKFEDISYNQIDLNYLKHLRIIPIKYKRKGKKYLKILLELQHFYVDNSTIRVLKISEDGKYLSVGLQNGKIKLYEIIGFDYTKFLVSYNKKNIMEYLNFIKEKAYKSLEGHKEDVIDLSWSPFYYHLLLSSSVDGYVILWNINLEEQKSKIECFNHERIVTSVSFSPTEKNIFITGCLDKIIRIWDINSLLEENESKSNINQNNYDIYEKYNKDYFNIEEKITSINYFPTGDGIAIGTHNGKLIIYELKGDKYFYKASYSCKNRIGKNSFGKKITSIEFVNKNYGIISSCDSRIRLLSMNDGKIIYKYKGYLNENSMIKSCIDYNYDIIITGSEDGFVYVWNIYNQDNIKTNTNYEYFKPYSQEKIQCSLIVPEKIYCNYMKKIFKITNKLMILSIIINATDKGRLEILLNIDDEN